MDRSAPYIPNKNTWIFIVFSICHDTVALKSYKTLGIDE